MSRIGDAPPAGPGTLGPADSLTPETSDKPTTSETNTTTTAQTPPRDDVFATRERKPQHLLNAPGLRKDASVKEAFKALDTKTGTITGEDLSRAINEGTRDLDSQAAGREFKHVQAWVGDNGQRLAPEAKEVFKVYEKYAKAAQGRGQTGIDQDEYKKMLAEMRKAAEGDVSAKKALAKLDKKDAPISGEDVARAIREGVGDGDGQAAGKEFKQFKAWADKNQDKLSAEAKEIFRAYEKVAKESQDKGDTGIPREKFDALLKEFKKITRRDDSASEAIETLRGKEAPISGEDLAKAIEDGTKDHDGRSAGKEFKQFKEYATQNWDKLSAEAKAVFRKYESVAKEAQAKGEKGITQADYDAMLKSFKRITERDDSASEAIEKLREKKAPISGEDLAKAIEDGTTDGDGQSAGKEFDQFKKWATNNWDKLSAEAKEVFRAYEKVAQAAKDKGETGVARSEFDKLLEEFKSITARDDSASEAIEKLRGKSAPISGEDLAKAIRRGIQDGDGEGAGKEFDQFKKYATENWDKLSAEAKEVFRAYEKVANAAKEKNEKGIDAGELKKLFKEFKSITKRDDSVSEAVEKLRGKDPISGEDLAKAIEDGARDGDGQAAGKEYDQLKEFATKNWDKLSAEAKEVFRAYEKVAKANQADDKDHISGKQWKKLVKEFEKITGRDDSASEAIEKLNAKSGKVSGEDLAKAIEEGTKDLDGEAAKKEFKQFAAWAKKNPDKLSPEAKQVMEIYEKAVDAAKKGGGEASLSKEDWDKMIADMKAVKPYEDASMGDALKALGSSGTVSGQALVDAIIKGAEDHDGQAAGKELNDLLKWSRENASRLSPEAKQAIKTYVKYATDATLRGESGIPQAEFDKLKAELKAIGSKPPRIVTA